MRSDFSLKSKDQPGKIANRAHGQLNQGKIRFPRPRSYLRVWSREMGSAVPSRVRLLISIIRLRVSWHVLYHLGVKSAQGCYHCCMQYYSCPFETIRFPPKCYFWLSGTSKPFIINVCVSYASYGLRFLSTVHSLEIEVRLGAFSAHLLLITTFITTLLHCF